MLIETIVDNVQEISTQFARDRHDRQHRRHLEPADFEHLRDAGYLLTSLPVEYGGTWQGIQRSTREVAETLRVLARGDSSVALVASMHPAVLGTPSWLTIPHAPEPFAEAWEAQRRWVFETASEGAWWGTISSEPGSGGDLLRTRAAARPVDASPSYRITGQKHFGSGTGITSYIITTAVPEGESEPDWFFIDMRGVPWDGSAGMTLVGAWDGHGMIATQSHGMRFDDVPATRAAWPGYSDKERAKPRGLGVCLFAAVVVGIVDVALETARAQLERRRESLSAYEQVEWTRAEMEGWLILQAYEGVLRAVEDHAGQGTLMGKTAIAELAETMMSRLCRVLGGGTYARHSPFGFWLQDVRALGFLRPPWSLAFEGMFKTLGQDVPPLSTEAERHEPITARAAD
ncbi:MAG TPA: acyl-CoA dehydrogenase family protein [Thermomicrobiales bacterium]|nr:acyl-CoA dehydrogenase family protein [Thermomicrobiales bacterium]